MPRQKPDHTLTKRRKPSELRALLLAAAEKTFKNEDYSDCTMESIAKEAGVTPSVLYRHFPTKRTLFREVLLLPFIHFLKQYSSTWKAQQHTPWTDRQLMHSMISDLYDQLYEHRFAVLSIALADTQNNKKTTGEVKKELDRIFDEILIIGEKEADRLGWFPKENLDLTIRMILGMVASASVLGSLFLPFELSKPNKELLIEHLTVQALYGLRLTQN